MKSRIPQPKPISIHEDPKPPVPMAEASDVHATLLALGAPPISLDDFKRLYKGPFADVLLFMSEHVKGRKGVARDRHLIQRIREARDRPHLRRPDDVQSPVDRATAAMAAARRAEEVLRTQLGERQAALAQSQSKILELKETLADKRQVALLLRVLEERERVRVRRFQEMTKIMDNLR
ncbi:hypothetical protein LshimejAT787_0902420 [Lyophyllum shimeji]|uniref:Uncharacterized protein n=1 Tax=Lyophyllum shimeji TaxID=47721 RepID=A0A9P3PTF7_LYOSH|nr:hypothetical protein LshimejAT787_0902420 [Lyophyllum shimeji]